MMEQFYSENDSKELLFVDAPRPRMVDRVMIVVMLALCGSGFFAILHEVQSLSGKFSALMELWMKCRF